MMSCMGGCLGDLQTSIHVVMRDRADGPKLKRPICKNMPTQVLPFFSDSDSGGARRGFVGNVS